jgi:hypothetical protein
LAGHLVIAIRGVNAQAQRHGKRARVAQDGAIRRIAAMLTVDLRPPSRRISISP